MSSRSATGCSQPYYRAATLPRAFRGRRCDLSRRMDTNTLPSGTYWRCWVFASQCSRLTTPGV